MPRPNPVRQATFEEYLKLEETSEVRHEFVDGYVFAMAGGTTRHNRIANRVNRLAYDASAAAECELYISDVKVVTPNERVYYPEVFLASEESDTNPLYKRSPCWIVEVLSESTEAIDRGEKLYYTLIPSLQSYVLLSQDKAKAEVYLSFPDGTWRYEVIREDGRLRLPCVGLDVGLEEIYAGV